MYWVSLLSYGWQMVDKHSLFDLSPIAIGITIYYLNGYVLFNNFNILTTNFKLQNPNFLIMATFNIDITKEHCPMTFVKTKIELSKLKQGDVLNVLVGEGEPLENIPKSSAEQGYKVLSVSETETKGTHLIVIQK